MKAKKDIKKEKSETLSARLGIAQVKTTRPSAKIIKDLADRLYRENMVAFRKIGVYRASSRVAVDYLMLLAVEHGAKGVSGLDSENNLWLALEKNGEEEY